MILKHLSASLEIKLSEDGTFEGYASTFGNEDCVRDVVRKGAFSKTLATGRRVKMLWQHEPSMPIGRWTALAEDSKGLHSKGQLIKSIRAGAEAYELMKAEAVDGLSIGFRTVADEIDYKTGARYLNEVDLHEISVVTFPANDLATISAVKNIELDPRELEAALRDAGLSRTRAAAAVTVFKGYLRDAGANVRSASRDAQVSGDLAEMVSAFQRAEEALRT